MRSLKNYLLLTLAVLVFGLALLAWKQYQELVALRGAALTNGERADWQKRVWAAQKHAQRLENELATARAAGPATPADTAGPMGGPPSRATMGRMMTGFASLMDRPEAARLMALQQKAQVDARYAALFKKLALPPDKLAQFKSLLGDWLSAPVDVLAAGSQQGINPIEDPEAFHQLVQATQSQIDDKIKALLDPGSYAEYQDYVQTEPQRAVVNQLQQSLSYTTTPLTSAQADQLVQILAQTSPNRSATAAAGTAVSYVAKSGSGGPVAAIAVGPPPADGGPLMAAGGSPVTSDAITQAQSVLSAPQLQALQQIQQQQQAASQLRQQMFQNATAGGTTPLPPPPPPPGG